MVLKTQLSRLLVSRLKIDKRLARLAVDSKVQLLKLFLLKERLTKWLQA